MRTRPRAAVRAAQAADHRRYILALWALVGLSLICLQAAWLHG